MAAVFTLVAAAGVFLVLRQVQLQRMQLHRYLENLYVERYWVVQDRINAAEPGSSSRDRGVLAYLELCEDQCDQRAQDRVTDQTWKIWGPTIWQQLNIPEYGEALDQQPEHRFTQLRKMRQQGSKHDPSELKMKNRKKEGLR